MVRWHGMDLRGGYNGTLAWNGPEGRVQWYAGMAWT